MVRELDSPTPATTNPTGMRLFSGAGIKADTKRTRCIGCLGESSVHFALSHISTVASAFVEAAVVLAHHS